MFGQPTYVRQPNRAFAARHLTRQQAVALRKRGMGQTPAPSLPTCSSLDWSTTVPQALLMTGGSIAVVTGIVGAIFSDDYGKDFAIAAGVGLVANLVGGLWAASSIESLVANNGVPNCTGPGIAALGPASVNPNQATPPGVPAQANPIAQTVPAAVTAVGGPPIVGTTGPT